MIKIPDKTVLNTVLFPKNTDEIPEIQILTLSRGGTDYVISHGNIEYLNDYIKMTSADFTSLEDGEYEYSLSSGEKGILRIGIIEKNTIVYGDNKEEYKFYTE